MKFTSLLGSSVTLWSSDLSDLWPHRIDGEIKWLSENTSDMCSALSSVQSLSHVWLFAIPWTAAHQAYLSITNSRSLIKLMSIELVMPSNLLILCHPLSPQPSSFPASGSFPMSQFFTSGGPCIGVLASASVLPMNTQDWFPFGWTAWIPLLSIFIINHLIIPIYWRKM